MTPDELRQVVIDALRPIAPEMSPATLRPRVPLRDQLDLDSMDLLNFIIALHERTGVEIPEAEYGQLTSIDAIVQYLSSKPAGGTNA
jgi:acyl carrier protein